jgi:hypothetical protein
MPFPKLRQNTSNEATRRANTLRKISFENLTLGGDRAHEIASRVQGTRTAHFETDFKTLIKKLGNKEKIVTQILDNRNTPKIALKSDELFGHHRGETGEPPSISGHVSRAAGVDQPNPCLPPAK